MRAKKGKTLVYGSAAAGPAIGAMLSSLGIEPAIVDYPDALPAVMDDQDLLVVHGCFFQMLDERYTPEQRAEFSYVSTPEVRSAISEWITGGGPVLAMHTAVLCFDGERSGRVPQRDGHAQLRALLAQVPTRHAVCRIGLFVEAGLAGGPLGALYPINAMRNAAIGLATSALVLPLDVDFLPCAGLHASLARPDALAAARRACCEERWMLVLPVRGSLTLTLALTLTLT